jgi:hypothetical protein
MISAAVGERVKVTGSSIAMVATGPMPGSTPTSVPRTTPTKQNKRFIQLSATPNPSERLCTNCRSIVFTSTQKTRPERVGKPEEIDEHQYGNDGRHDGKNQHFL